MTLPSVVLLRGVNVGGKHRVPSNDFADVLTSLGAETISTLLNSGNAVAALPAAITAAHIQDALEAVFGFSIPTLLLPGERVLEIAAALPDDWTNDPPTPEKSGSKSDVAYLFPALDGPAVLDALGYRPELETLRYVPGAVLSNVSRRNQRHSSLYTVIGTPLYQHLTVRNVNTARKLAALVRATQSGS